MINCEGRGFVKRSVKKNEHEITLNDRDKVRAHTRRCDEGVVIGCIDIDGKA